MSSLNPVRDLQEGEQPREWGLEGEAPSCPRDAAGSDSTGSDSSDAADRETHAPARVGNDELADLEAPQRFKVEFTATEEYVRLVQEAKALLSHRAPRVTLEELQLRAMRAFVETLRKRKYGSKEPSSAATGGGAASHASGIKDRGAHASPLGFEASANADADTRVASSANRTPDSGTPSDPRQRGRYIPAAVRRAVAARDAHRCAYVDASGTRCSETQRLEFHHLVPFAVRRSHDVSTLALRCQAHNALAAEQDFGRDLVDERRSAARHDSFSEHGP